ncbi:unnamed protein product [Oreochromis niloticus]|nr:unnamed protein product [Mustela putorius furo]
MAILVCLLTTMLKAHRGGWCLFFLAAVIPGVHFQSTNGSIQPALDSELHSKGRIYRPVLQPSEATPQIGKYVRKDPQGKPCIRISMGAEFLVTENKKTWYFDLDPSRVEVTGYCGKEEAVLSLTLPDNGASLQFKFKKEKNVFYVIEMNAHLSPMPVCKDCSNKTYKGVLAHEKLFKTANGRSFTCKSENLLLMSSELKIKLVPVKMQAFDLSHGQYGKEVECWADYNKRIIPIVIGAAVVCLILIIVMSFLVVRDRRRDGYERI